MIKTQFKYYIFILTLLVMQGNLFAQNPEQAYLNSEIQERQFDKEQWSKTIEGMNYSKDLRQQKEDYDIDYTDSLSNNQTDPRKLNGEGGNSGAFWAGFFKVLFIIIIIAAIALLISSFLGAGLFTGPKNKKIKKIDSNITIENIEEHLYESDLDRYIREATEQGKYALAIRLYYLAIIKELSINKTIHWKKDKTNKDYLYEMSQTEMFQPFREVTQIFERVWYGVGDISNADYKILVPKFEALIQSLRINPISGNYNK